MMKKVLFTGPSGISCGLGNRLGIISNTTSLMQAFNDLNYEVEQRPVIPGENLDKYDKVFVTQQTIASFTAPYAHGMMWAIGSVDPEKLLIVYDDWQAPEAFKAINKHGMTRKGQNHYEATLDTLWRLERKYEKEARDNSTTIERAVALMTLYDNGLRYLVPTMGKRDLPVQAMWESICFGKPILYDPSPYMDIYSYVDSKGLPYGKKKRHILAALQDNTNWLSKRKVTWPIVQLGVKKLGQPRVEEDQLAKMYAASWSIVSPPHNKLKDSSWFRVRNYMAATAKSILVMDPDKCFDHDYYISMEVVEQLSNAQLRMKADVQNEIFFSHCWSKKRLIDFCDSLSHKYSTCQE